MSSRSRRNAGAVHVVCRDPRHGGTRDWAEHGYRLVAKLQFAERAEHRVRIVAARIYTQPSQGAVA